MFTRTGFTIPIAFILLLSLPGYSQAQGVWMRAGEKGGGGINLIYEDRIVMTEINGRKCLATDADRGGTFISFDIDDSFVYSGDVDEAILIIEYFDIGNDTFAVQYDSVLPWPYSGAFMRAGRIIKKENTKRWRTYSTRIRNVAFANRQGYGPASSSVLDKGGGDFRINSRGDGNEYISSVEVRIPHIAVSVNESGNIFTPKEDISIVVKVNNRGDSDFSPALKYDIVDSYGDVVLSGSEDITVPKGSVLPCIFNVESDKKGVFFAHFILKQNNETIEERETSFAICDEPRPHPSYESPFGVTAILDHGEVPRAANVLKRLNVSWVRHDFKREYIEAQKGRFDWRINDEIVGECYKKGINIAALLIGSNISDPTTGSDEALEGFSGFVSNVVYRYKDKIKYWEIWNEPDLWGFWPSGPNVENYTKLLKTSYTAVKKIDPNSKVLSAGLTGGPKGRFWFLDHIYKNGGRDHFDIVGIHPYVEPDSPERNNALENKITDVITRLQKQGEPNKKVCITEIGWPTAVGGDARSIDLGAQAYFLVRAYIIALSNPNVEKVFWHEFRDLGLDPMSAEQNFGLVSNDFTPKPAAIAYLNMANQIGGLEYVGRMDLEDPLRGYIFGDGNKKVRVLWSAGAAKTVAIPLEGASVSIIDIMGNTSRTEAGRGRLRFTLTESPVFLKE